MASNPFIKPVKAAAGVAKASATKAKPKISPKPKLPVPVEAAIERCAVYSDGAAERGQYTYTSALKEVRERGEGFVWLALREPDERQMLAIANAYDVHELIAEDAVTAHQRPKVERYDDQLFFVVRSVRYREHESVTNAKEIIQTGEVQMILGPDFIITITHSGGTNLAQIRRLVDAEPEQVAMGPTGISWVVADILVDQYLAIAQQLSTDVDELETEVFTPDTRFDIEQIYMLKREILEMRHAIDPLATALRSLIANHKDILSKELRSYYRDVLDHELIAADQIASYDERLSSLIDAGVAMISLQQNNDMRKISALVGMAALPTMIAGIYGMNFENMPELQSPYGYYICLAVMVLSVVLMWWFMKKNRWL
ncbi:magnesium and cobalt transport protein CorA [Corynebacterium aquilae]|uniref:magnesium and cobalt transport protein CorA n=1 Tax=Corynebacterium aquilae TaxID=203263 RepID=UPI000A01A076|nr:magnesium and cobalt transport protein CorA [Corynebacterium aquilae]